MKRILLMSITALVLPIWGYSSEAPSPVTLQAADSIPSIRKRYAAINKGVPKYKKIKKELAGFSLEGGELVAYFDGPLIVKITAQYFGESGKALEEYYYMNEKLIFVFRRDYTYDAPMSGKVVGTQANRFYFGNERLVRWIDQNGKLRSLKDGDAQAKQQEFLETSTKFLKAARSTEPTIDADNTGANVPRNFQQGAKHDDERKYRQARTN